MKTQGGECTRIISLLKVILGKHFKVFHKITNTADELNNISLCNNVFVCECFFYVCYVCIYVYYISVICLYVNMLQCSCVAVFE